MKNRHWIDLQVLYDSVKNVVFTVTCLGKNVLVGRDFSVTRKTGKHLMTGKRRKTPKFCRKSLKKSSFIVL